MNSFKSRLTLPTILIVLAFAIMVWLIIMVVGDWPWNNKSEINWDIGSKFGDLVGGILAFLSILFLYFTIRNQLFSFEKNQFENRFFQLLSFHRENVKNLSYKVSHNELDETKIGGDVLLHIFREIQEANIDVNDYFATRGFPRVENYFQKNPKLEEFYDKIKKDRPNIPFNNLLILDISYLIVFYGLSDESQSPLEIAINMRYDYNDFASLIRYLKEKTGKCDDREETNNLEQSIGIGFNYKYYAGHQIRLGHYFRHLYQLIHYVNKQDFLNFSEKYDYVKTVRAQLSTYEQGILWYSSLSSLGYKWEYLAEKEKSNRIKNYFCNRYRSSINNELITKYNLIKNLPQGIIQTFTIQMFYEDVEFDGFSNIQSKRSKYKSKIYR